MVYSDNIYENTGYILRNLNKSATQAKDTWVSGTGYGFYSTYLEKPLTMNHLYYQRYYYKFSTTNQSPTWVNYYLYGGMQGGSGKSGGLTANTEYLISGIVTPNMGAGNSPRYMTIYNGESGAISGVTSYVKDVLVYDVTDLFLILKAKGVISNSHDSLKTWCDSNLLYVPTNVDYDITEHTILLPSGYQQLKYIESTGTQWIDTQVLINSSNYNKIRYILDCKPTSTAVGNRWWAHGIGGGSTNTFYVGIGNGSSSSYPFTYGSGCYDISTSVYGSIGVRYIWDYDTSQRTYKVYDENYNLLANISNTSLNAPTANGYLSLFCWRYYSGSVGYCHSNVFYKCIIYDSGKMIRMFIPAKRTSDSAIGLFDVVNNTFYGNSGSGTFTAGPVINTSNANIPHFISGGVSCSEVVEPDGMRKYSSNSSLANDPWFDSSNPTSVYNNSGGGTVTHERVSASLHGSPFAGEHPYVLKIETNGTASPYAGGFVAYHTSAANKVFVEKFVAKVPVGWSVTAHYNSQGSGASVNFITSQEGTGDWKEYAILYRCGSSGSFSSGGHVALYGPNTGKNVLPWELNPYHWGIEDYQSRTTHYYKNGVVHFDSVSGNTSDTGLRMYASDPLTLSANTTYYLSFDVRTNYIGTIARRSSDWSFNLKNGSTYYLPAANIIIPTDGQWHRIQCAITTGSATSYNLNLSVEEDLIGDGKYFEIKNPMLSTSSDITYRAPDNNSKVTWYLAYVNNTEITGKEQLMNYSVLPRKTSIKEDKIFSKEFNVTNLMTNGDCHVQDTTYLPSGWYYDVTDYAGNATCSLVQPVGAGSGIFGPLLPVDPMNRYKVSFWVKCKQDMSSFLTAICYYGSDGSGPWTHSVVNYYAGTKTTLSAALNNGDTQMTVASNSNWASRSYSRLGFRSSIYNVSYNNVGTSHGYSGSTGLISGTSGSNIVTFNTAYSGSTIPAGTCVVESKDGATYPYPIQKDNLPTDNTWKYVEGYFGSQEALWDGAGSWNAIPADARYVRLYLNIYNNNGSVPIKYSDMRITPVTADNGRLEKKVSITC